jgi:hypothetical protein
MGPPVSLYFMHVNSRHHSLAIAQGPHNRMHHLMMEFYSLDDVGQSYDIAQQQDRVVAKFGRHSNDFMTSFYMRTPAEFLIEHGWGGREVTPDWQPAELKSAGSFWGHILGSLVTSSITKAIKITVSDALRVSGLLQNPPDARACYVLAHGAGAGMDHPFMAAVAAELARRQMRRHPR